MNFIFRGFIENLVKGYLSISDYLFNNVLLDNKLDTSDWTVINTYFAQVAGLMAVIAVAIGAVGVVSAMFKGNIKLVLWAVVKTVFSYPITVIVVMAAQYFITAIDELSTKILSVAAYGTTQNKGLDGYKNLLTHINLEHENLGFLFVLGLIGIIAAIVLWIMIQMRLFLLIIGLSLAPIVFMTQGWSAMRGMVNKYGSFILGLILVKPIMILISTISMSLIGAGNSSANTNGVVVGIVGTILAAFMPFKVIELFGQILPGGAGIGAAAAAGGAAGGIAGSMFSRANSFAGHMVNTPGSIGAKAASAVGGSIPGGNIALATGAAGMAAGKATVNAGRSVAGKINSMRNNQAAAKAAATTSPNMSTSGTSPAGASMPNMANSTSEDNATEALKPTVSMPDTTGSMDTTSSSPDNTNSIGESASGESGALKPSMNSSPATADSMPTGGAQPSVSTPSGGSPTAPSMPTIQPTGTASSTTQPASTSAGSASKPSSNGATGAQLPTVKT